MKGEGAQSEHAEYRRHGGGGREAPYRACMEGWWVKSGAVPSVMSQEMPAATIALLDTMRETGDFPRGMANAVKTKGWSDWEQSGPRL